MPVVSSIYNTFTGLAVGLEGFVLQNPALMIAGSGLIAIQRGNFKCPAK
jgi:NAD/NADP transhydrogenase beta subunit